MKGNAYFIMLPLTVTLMNPFHEDLSSQASVKTDSKYANYQVLEKSRGN